MSSAILSLLISHILTFVESELTKEEPAIQAALIQDLQSLIAKLEALIATKLPSAAPALDNALNDAGTVATAAVQAAGAAIQQGVQTPQSVE